MRKILTFITAFLFVTNCYGADINDFMRGDSSDVIKGTDNVADVDSLLTNYLVDPLERLLTESIHGCELTWATNATVTIAVGEVTCYNSAKTIRRMRRNTSTVTITLPASGASGDSLDTGNAAISTWYHVYAVADADATTFTGICSASASAPTGVTYYRYLGSFYNNAADNISNFSWSGKGSYCQIMWDIPINITTANSAGAWSGALSCAAGMPSTSTSAIFGLSVANAGSAYIYIAIRPNGTTWSTEYSNGIRLNAVGDVANIGGQRLCMTDSSQQIQHYEPANQAGATRIDVEGYYITR